MDTVINYLEKNPTQYLATIGLDGKAKVRPFQFMLTDGGKLWFCTGNKKDVYDELMAQPEFELCVSDGQSWLRISGKAIFEDNLDIKNKVIAHSELVRLIYKSADNPQFEVFYIGDGVATIQDFSGKPPQIIGLE